MKTTDETVKILLVDDEPRNLDALESILQSTGCDLIRAQTADQALIAILQNEFAAIVLDIKEYLGGDIDGETFIFLSKDQVKQLVNFLTEEEENE